MGDFIRFSFLNMNIWEGYSSGYVVIAVRATDKRIACDEEFSDSEDEGEGGRRNTANHKKGVKRPRVDEDKKEGEEKKPGRSF